MSVKIRFERGRDDVIGPTHGPYDFVQITYESLRDSNGDDIAKQEEGGDWIAPDGIGYSDIIIFEEAA